MWPHGLQHARLPCLSLSPGLYSNSYPSSRWCQTTTSSSVLPFSSCLQPFPASMSFPEIWLFASKSLSIGASASASVLPMNSQSWFPWGLTSLISSSTTVRKHQFFGVQPSLWSNSHIHSWLLDLFCFICCKVFLVLGDKGILAYMERYPQFLPLWHKLSVNWSPLVYYMCVCVCVCAELLQSCQTLCDPVDYSLPHSSVPEILREKILEWVALPSSRESSQPRDQIWVCYIYLLWQVSSLPLAPPGKPVFNILDG